MKKYRIRKGSLIDMMIPVLVMAMVIFVMGIGTHMIDGI